MAETVPLREKVRLKLRERRLQPRRTAAAADGVTPPVYVKAHPVENWARLGYYAALHTAQALRSRDDEFAAHDRNDPDFSSIPFRSELMPITEQGNLAAQLKVGVGIQQIKTGRRRTG